MTQEGTNDPFTHGIHRLVGHGKVTNGHCGQFARYRTCFKVDLHKYIIDGKSHRGQVFNKIVINSCDKPSCPKCYKFGWAVREARKIKERIDETGKKLGLEPEHVSVNFPPKFWELSLPVLRLLGIKALESRGAIAGCLISHAHRYRNWVEARQKHKPVGRSFEFHFHAIVFLKGDYKCRECKLARCSVCDGFEGVTRKQWKKDEIIVEVAKDIFGEKSKRKSVYHTAWYQLTHASYDRTAVRPQVVIWFGVCSYRNLKVKVERVKASCEHCKHELRPSWHVGKRSFVTDRESPDFVSRFWADYLEDGKPAWIPAPEDRFLFRHGGHRDENPTFMGDG